MGPADQSDATAPPPDPNPSTPVTPEGVTRRIYARTIARARLPHRGVAYRGGRTGGDGGRGVAKVPKDDEVTTLLEPPGAVARPVFVDDTGRRGRWLAWAMVTMAMVALLLIAAFWFSQATSASAGL